MQTQMPAASEQRLCLSCRYELDNLPFPRCPECGREFNPQDPRTYLIPRRLMVPAWLSQAPDRNHGILAGFAVLLALVTLNPFAGRPALLLVAIPLWAALVFTAALRLLARVMIPPRRHRRRPRARTFYTRTLLIMAAPLFVVAGFQTDFVVRVSLLLNRGAYADVANQLERSGFTVLDIEDRAPALPQGIAAFGGPGEVYIELGERNGIYFRPRRWDGVARIRSAPVNKEGVTLRRLFRDWYVWRFDSDSPLSVMDVLDELHHDWLYRRGIIRY